MSTDQINLEGETLGGLARIIQEDWSQIGQGVSPHAQPYLDAMKELRSIDQMHGMEYGDMVVAYFLNNAVMWRGQTAQEVKAELKRRIDEYNRGPRG